MAYERRRKLPWMIFNKKRREEEKERSKYFLENGGMLLKEFMAFSNGRYDVPIRNFSAKEIIEATNNFDSRQILFHRVRYSTTYRGSFGERPVLIKKYESVSSIDGSPKSEAIRNFVITSLMSSHKNVINLIGCCLEFQFLAMVYDNAGRIEQHRLPDCLYRESMLQNKSSLLWKNRLRIANEIASTILYLHTAFSTPIIHRDLTPGNIVLDQFGIPKLFDFSICVRLPPGKTKLKGHVAGTLGYLDPEYFNSTIVTVQSDVYGFGMILLVLFSGKQPIRDLDLEGIASLHWVKDFRDKKDQFHEILDPRILNEGEVMEREQQLQDFLKLALKCTQEKGEDRPEMIEVGRELKRIQTSAY